ncbi:MAG TPA: twin-arginine translocase TatA/TatE family subunit [Candidatus Methylomirabilis sp.]|jgi:sec-independent protein translocase protein TatA
MFGLGLPELLIILFLALLLFGANRLPEIGSSLGKAIRGFKESTDKPEETKAQVAPGAGPFCPGCGKPHAADAAFCPSCGRDLKAGPPAP